MILSSGRSRLALIFSLLLIAALRFAGQGLNPADQQDLDLYQSGAGFLRALTTHSESLFADADQRQLQDLLLQLLHATNYWSQSSDSASAVVKQARRDSADAVARLSMLLDKSSQVERVWLKEGKHAESSNITRIWPYGSGAILLRVGRQDMAAGTVPRFVRAQQDLSKKSDLSIDVGTAQTTYVIAFFNNAPAGSRQATLRVRSAGLELAQLRLTAQVPPTGTIRITVVDETGRSTPSVTGVYGQDNQLIVPDTALAFDNAGFYYTAGRVRQNSQAHYWPGNPQQRRVFFTDGSFSLRLPEGDYRLIAGKGTEYLPISETFAVKAGADVSRQIALKRWVDMPARGWFSGDGHVHYERRDPEANRKLLLWTQAEDVHIANVLRMGDARQTYFEQYGFGKTGRFLSGAYVITPGQEDPRTNVIGHTLHLNLQKPMRAPERYYLYDLVFDETHRQGGLTGYAHTYRPPETGYFVQRDMTLNIPRNKIDFSEICEFGDIGLESYYEFLNLGFPLTATAGSDVPWGNTIGTSRVYAYTGATFNPDAWFAAVKAGKTFVTSGPMLQFTVNGELPGSVIQARRGDTLRVKASAFGRPTPPGFLEIVSQGDVVRCVRPSKENDTELSAEFTVPVRGSMWIAARSAGAHTTPVYVKVDGRRFWRLDQVKTLVAKRMDQLRQMEEVSGQEIPVSHLGNWDNPVAMKESAQELREKIAVVRGIYQDLLTQAKKEQAESLQ